MDAAKHDEFSFRVLRDLTRQTEGVASVVGKFDDFVALIMMTQNDQPAAEGRLRSRNPAIELLI
jgi:hypothetical protein